MKVVTCLWTCVATSQTFEVCWCDGREAGDTHRDGEDAGPCCWIRRRAAPRLGGSISAGSLTSTQQLVPSSCQSPYFDLLWILRLSKGAWSLLSFGTAPRCVGEEQGKSRQQNEASLLRILVTAVVVRWETIFLARVGEILTYLDEESKHQTQTLETTVRLYEVKQDISKVAMRMRYFLGILMGKNIKSEPLPRWRKRLLVTPAKSGPFHISCVRKSYI